MKEKYLKLDGGVLVKNFFEISYYISSYAVTKLKYHPYSNN